MRNITKFAVRHFYEMTPFRMSNTQVYYLGGCWRMDLFGNTIAKLYIGSDGTRVISLTDGGHQTRTTSERLNGILQYKNLGKVYQRDYLWYYENEDGKIRHFDGGIARKI